MNTAGETETDLFETTNATKDAQNGVKVQYCRGYDGMSAAKANVV